MAEARMRSQVQDDRTRAHRLAQPALVVRRDVGMGGLAQAA